MIQFNLLPDVKIAFIKAERQKHIVMSVSTIASIAAVIIFVLLFSFVNVAQKKNIKDLTKDIKRQNTELMKTNDISKIITVQNQLASIDALHDNKVIASRAFGYIQQMTPATVTISELDVDFEANTMTITGNSPSLSAVNTYADGMKFTKYTRKSDGTKNYAFKDVVLSALSVKDKSVYEYTFTLSFDPLLFSQTEDTAVQVPDMITTRSVTERPTLFQKGGN
jgi:hypothetical protein